MSDVFARQYDTLHRWAGRLLILDPMLEGDDILHDVLLAALERGAHERARDDAAFLTYASWGLRRRAIDVNRRRKFRACAPLEIECEGDGPSVEGAGVAAADLASLLGSKAADERLRVTLLSAQGYDMAEIAEREGATPNAIRARIFKWRARWGDAA